MELMTKTSVRRRKSAKIQFWIASLSGIIFLIIPTALIITDPMFIIGKYRYQVGESTEGAQPGSKGLWQLAKGHLKGGMDLGLGRCWGGSLLENGTILHEILKEELECGRFSVFLFNITNADSFMSGEDTKLKLQEIGPFTYVEYRTNENLELKDGVMRYTPNFRSVFVPEESIAHPEDVNVTLPNIPMLAATTLLSSSPYIIRSIYNLMVKQLKSKPLINLNAFDYLWGYHEPVLSLANNMVPGLVHFNTTGIMDRLYDKQSSYRLELGATDKDKFSVKSVKQYRHLKLNEFENHDESTATFTNTYEGIAYPPKITPTTPVNIYRVGMCRTFELSYTGKTTSEYGPDAFVYEISNRTFSNTTLCNSKGFCPEGLMDMSSCYFGLPLAMSKSHFLGADPQLLEKVEGLHPDPQKHSSHMVIEPKIGLTLETSLSLQVNIVLGNLDYNSEAQRLSDTVLPIAHFKISQPRLPEIAIKALTFMYITMPQVLLVVDIVFCFTGIILLAYSVRLFFCIWLSKNEDIIFDLTSSEKSSHKNAHKPLIENLDLYRK